MEKINGYHYVFAKRYADCVVKEVGPNPGQATVVPGHQIAEMALARLYTLTGEKKYLPKQW